MFAKLILTILAVATVWFGFRYYARFIAGPTQRRATEPRDRGHPAPPPAPTGAPVEDMTPCAVCGAYVPANGAKRCGRPECPL